MVTQPEGHKMTARKAQQVAPEFTRTRDFQTRYSVMNDFEADIVAVWTMTTWCFSPMCQWPATFPYLYITAPAGSGKTVLGQDVLGATCRQWRSATGATGPTLFRMLGREDEETGEIENLAPTLFMDEIDATFNGAKDEPLRQGLDAGYRRGATIPRAAGKTTIDFPIYGPKLMAGIDNGHLPDTVTQRSIRIQLERHTQDELDKLGVEPFYIFDVEDESADIQQMLSDYAKAHSMVLRDYRPKAPKGLTARQWECSRALVQMAHEIGIEDRIVKALVTLFSRKQGQVNAKTRLYRAIADLFDSHPGVDKFPSRVVLAHLQAQGVGIPGNSGKGLASTLAADGISPRYLFIDNPTHPFYREENGKAKPTHRGYQRYMFDQAFTDYLDDDDDDE